MLRIQPNSSATSRLSEATYVPLKRVHVDAVIHSFAANVTITQVFRNDETTPIEAVYCFPVEENAAVYSFIAQIDDREIIAQLKEKQEAQKEYTDALQQGHGAYLLEQDENSQDNFIINIGALPPSKECTIKIAYVTELEFTQGSTIRFVVPTTIAPRYNPAKSGIASPAGTSAKYVQSTPYTIEFRCRIDKMTRLEAEYIARINSPSHPIQVDFGQSDAYVVTFSQENMHLDRDILVNIELSSKRTNTIVAVEPGAVMAVFTPTEEDCRRESNAEQVNEFLFVIDCSGSMSDENKIGLARQAMLLFLKSLPVDCFFNIIRFGSTHQSLFPQITAVYNETNAQQAERLIDRMQADLGGTELLKPLQWLEGNPPKADRARQVFLLTDGEISNVTEVLDLCRSMASSTRIFSFGLGTSPSRSLVKGFARSTHGRFVFIPPNSNVDTYVGQQLQYALQPCVTDLDVQWNLGVAVQSAPLQLPPVYVNDRLITYALTCDRTIPFDHHASVVLKSKSNQKPVGTAKVDQIPNVAENDTIARLAAKALILELQHAKTPSSTARKSPIGSMQSRFQNLLPSNEETVHTKSDEQTTKERIVALSLQYHILSPHTAFVGIEKRAHGNNAGMVLREVPIEISADDQHLQSATNLVSRRVWGGYGMASAPGSRGRGGASALSQLSMSTLCFRAPPNRVPPPNCMPPQQSGHRQNSASQMSTMPLVHRSAHRERSRSRERSTNEDGHRTASQTEQTRPSNAEDTVRDLIRKQKYDGLWNLTDDAIVKLTGKPLSTFQSIDGNMSEHILVSLIVVLLLETRFAAFSSLWHGVVQKARKQIKKLVSQDSKDMDTLAEAIRQQL